VWCLFLMYFYVLFVAVDTPFVLNVLLSECTIVYSLITPSSPNIANKVSTK
jgi:hypothetical protein